MSIEKMVDEMSQKTGLTKKDSKKAIQAFQEIVIEALKREEEVRMIGFATFKFAQRPARVAHSPRDPKKTIKVPAHKTAVCKMSKRIKEVLN